MSFVNIKNDSTKNDSKVVENEKKLLEFSAEQHEDSSNEISESVMNLIPSSNLSENLKAMNNAVTMPLDDLKSSSSTSGKTLSTSSLTDSSMSTNGGGGSGDMERLKAKMKDNEFETESTTSSYSTKAELGSDTNRDTFSDILSIPSTTSSNAAVCGGSSKYDEDDEAFDFTKTGAKPKTRGGKNAANIYSKSSLSSSTSSSLSSLSIVSQHSSQTANQTASSSINGGGGGVCGPALQHMQMHNQVVNNSAINRSYSKTTTSSNTSLSSIKSSKSTSKSSSSGIQVKASKSKPMSFDSSSSSICSSTSTNKRTHTLGLDLYGDKFNTDNDIMYNNDAAIDDDLNLGGGHKNFLRFNRKNSDLLINTSKDLTPDSLVLNTNDDNVAEKMEAAASQTATVESQNDANTISSQASVVSVASESDETCPLCLKGIKTDLNTHFIIEHKEYECSFCNLLFDTDSSLNQHLNMVHASRSGGSSTSGGSEETQTTNRKQQQHQSLDDELDELLVENGKEIDEVFICPICQQEATSQIWLEMHVESHFNGEETTSAQSTSSSLLPPAELQNKKDSGAFASAFLDPFDLISMSKLGNTSRTMSNSSLAANVDENFEVDQIMTLTEGTHSDNDNDIDDYNSHPITTEQNEIFLKPISDFDSSANASENKRSSAMISSDEKKEENNVSLMSIDVEPIRDRVYQQSAVNSRNSDDVDMLVQSDFEIAMLLDKEERERFQRASSNEDFLKAQEIERKENENLKYKIYKESEKLNDEDLAASLNVQSDSEYAAELEHEWLKQKYGMTDTKSTTKAIQNLDRALKTNKIDHFVYQREKDLIQTRCDAVYDDDHTKSSGLIELIRSEVKLNRNTRQRLLCTACDHYSSSFIDSGYGCGYRNIQMLMSAIRQDPALAPLIFNNGITVMPSIKKLQQLIERAWSLGFDVLGKAQLGGKLVNTSKWIGASDVCAMFSSLRVKTELIDIVGKANTSAANEKSAAQILFRFVHKYFEEQASQSENSFLYPIYLQHDGHSRTIVGIEMGAKSNSLLLFDPGTRKSQIETFRANPFKTMHVFRKTFASFKKNQYQLLIVRGKMNTDREYEEHKVLKSTKITS